MKNIILLKDEGIVDAVILTDIDSQEIEEEICCLTEKWQEIDYPPSQLEFLIENLESKYGKDICIADRFKISNIKVIYY